MNNQLAYGFVSTSRYFHSNILKGEILNGNLMIYNFVEYANYCVKLDP